MTEHTFDCPSVYKWESPQGILYRTGFVEDSLCDCVYGTVRKLEQERDFYKNLVENQNSE
jgi:hypothetical protein